MSKLFYIKKALGKNNKKLNIYKFRTMKPGSARREVYSRKKLDKFGKPKNSEMITPMGRFLRKYWLDEIPQIYQVLIGNMSLVGIRPRSAKSWKIYPKRHKKRALKYKPGLISATNAFELKSFNDLLKAEQKYLDDYEKNPWKTQILYLKKIMFNIFFNGLRSR